MIKAINSKTIENLRDGMKDGMDTAWKASRRMQFRSPVVYDKPAAIRAGSWIGLGLFSIAAVALGAWMYFRKRKQVADRYTMGEQSRGEGPGEASAWDADPIKADGQFANPAI